MTLMALPAVGGPATIETTFGSGGLSVTEAELLARITTNPSIFGGKPIIRGKRIAVEHVLDMLAAGDSVDTILEGYSFLAKEDIQACLAYARKVVGHERIEPFAVEAAP
jgi:uncharacterized protein (DUF433 family)